MLDCIIIGGGPAGLTAALYLARFRRSVTVLDAGGGRARLIPATHNFAPFPDGIAGPDLLDHMRASAERYGASILPERAVSIAVDDAGFRVVTNGQSHRARALVLATGVTNHRPPLSEADHARALAQGLIRYCPVCDGYEARDMRIAVLGAGRHGANEARFLGQFSSDVTLIAPAGYIYSADVTVADAPLADLALTKTEVVATLVSGAVLTFDTLYAALGTTPCTDLAAALGVRLTDDGLVKVDARQRTSVNGVYAVGDLTEALDQIGVAMGQAAIAATALHNDLSERDRR